MNLIIVGCEYAGKTTLADEIVKWTERTMGGGRGFHDHFSIPSPELTPEGQEQMLAASVEIKEMFQRYMIQYHMNHSFYSDADHNMVGFHIENYIYGELYYGFDTVYQDKVFAHEERELMREAPHSILLLLKASPEVIRQRMKDDPHDYQVVRDGDVETVLERFEERFDASGIRRKLTLDTTSATVEETLAEFDAQIQQHLTDSDRQRILTKRALSG